MARLMRITGSEAGFTIIEMTVVAALTLTLLAIGVGALRSFWLERSLTGAQDQVVTQMREVQERSVAESYPTVYGIRFLKGTSSFGVVRYNSANQTCQSVNNQTFGDGVKVVNDVDTDFPDVTTLTAACRTATPLPAGATTANYEVVFFYPKGSTNATSTIGSVKLDQPAMGRTKEVTVSPLTGRVVRS